MKPTWLKKPKLIAEFIGKVTVWEGKDKDGDEQTVVLMQSSTPFKLKKKKA